jgi:hypothetical protein
MTFAPPSDHEWHRRHTNAVAGTAVAGTAPAGTAVAGTPPAPNPPPQCPLLTYAGEARRTAAQPAPRHRTAPHRTAPRRRPYASTRAGSGAKNGVET